MLLKLKSQILSRACATDSDSSEMSVLFFPRPAVLPPLSLQGPCDLKKTYKEGLETVGFPAFHICVLKVMGPVVVVCLVTSIPTQGISL